MYLKDRWREIGVFESIESQFSNVILILGTMRALSKA
jgi:hypothetical protein